MTNEPIEAHDSFKFITRQYVPSLQIEVQSFEHIITGAQHFHIASDSDENVFFVALRTMPDDSTGVAHILEHTALCGSQRYPVRDPFFMMIRRSLNTFMNAFTSSDWTAYPFASQNRKDFFNLLDVYLDAVFFSRLDPLDFAQEGHRLEFEKGEDPSTPLQFKGVVFNEMKGAMSSVTSQLYQELYRHLYPTTTYHHNSGGTPSHIPDLSYDQLLAFYKTHYHPSNATFMTFGNYKAIDLQTVFHEKALKAFDRLDRAFIVPPEKRYYAPVNVESAYGLDEESLEQKTYHSLAWLLGDCTDVYAQLEGEFLSELLLGNSAAPLRKALETCDIGTGPSPVCGTDTSPREMSFLVGLEGSDPAHAGAFEDLVLSTLHSVADKGIDQALVDAAVHQLEISQREISSGGYPFGLSVIMSAIAAAIHHGDPVDALNIDPHLDTLRKNTRDPNYIKTMIQRLLLDNPHRVRLTLRPNSDVNQRMQQEENQTLQLIQNALTDEDKKELVHQAKALAERQAQEDDPSILPKVTRDDVPVEVKHPTDFKHQHKIPIRYFEAGTNGLVYLTNVVDLSSIPSSDTKGLIPFTSWITQLGYEKLSYLDVQQQLTATTGGISCSVSETPLPDGSTETRGALCYSGKALARNLDPLIKSMNSFIHAPRFDEIQRIKELTGLISAQKERSIPRAGHQYAALAACAALHPSSSFNHQFGGLAEVRYWKALHESAQKGSDLFNLTIESCQQLSQLIADQPRNMLFISEKESMAGQLDTITKLCKNGRGFESCQAFPWEVQAVSPQSYWITNTQVNFVATANLTVPYIHEDSPALRVLASLLSNKFLHTAIREKGGAYGGGAKFSPLSGCFSFYSYRDPRMEETLADFKTSIDWIQDAPLTEQDLEEAILTIISTIDKPKTPASEAGSEFFNEFHGCPAAMRDLYRASVLSVTLDDVKRVASTWLKIEDRAVAVVGPATNRDKAESMGLSIEVI